MTQFIHLHNHTHYSLLDGLTKLDELIEQAKADDAPAVALTDHGTMYGIIEFYQKAKKAGIKPIIGVETYLAPNKLTDKFSKADAANYHLLLLVKNEIGYKNLIKLVSIAHLEGYYYKPRIDWEILSKHSEGLIACSACLGGEIPQLILSGKIDRAKERIMEYNNLFGQGNYYLEIQHHPNLPEQAPVNEQLIKLSRELGVPLVATNDLHYLKKDDFDAQDVLLCLQTKRKKNDTNRMEMHGQDFYYKPAAEMANIFKDVPEAVENTVKIAEMCNLEIKLGEIQLPIFPVPEGMTEFGLLSQWCHEGLMKRYEKDYDAVDAPIRERMDYELSVIERMGWPSYFLIVADFINWAKNNGIVVGPGRGSAAGSLVCYLIGITNLDPLKYNLLFERFLNPERISMPDIDTDFSDVRREDVIRYVEGKYGKDHVSQIITFGTMAARAAIRDVGRVLDFPYDFCDKLAKMIPQFSKIDEALETVSEFKEVYQQDEGARRLIDYARRLEGVARHASTHACGVLITKNPLTDYVPVQYASSSDMTIVSQYSLHPVEDLGLLKMDFLGLKNLTIIESAIKIIKNTRGIDVDIDNIPLDDKRAYKLFQDGETTGVFQFESSGMKRYLKELRPTDLEDIIAMVALYRPGPMEWIPDYIAGKHGKVKPYLHPKLEPILGVTHGVAIYQEQVMQMARDLAGFTMGEADVLRKAMGKKIVKLLAEQKEKFIDGCVKNGISSDLAQQIFAFIEPFAGYGFNRSHAACYALIGYQTAYLKANWPTEFMAALLTADQQDTDRVAIEIDECRKMGIEVLAPDINQSFASFTVVTSGTLENKTVEANEKVNTIRFGLRAIKNVGENIVDVLIAERKANGQYRDLADLLERVTDKDMNKKSLDSLIKSGAFDNWGERGRFLANLESILSYSKEVTKNKNTGQVSLFGDLPLSASARPTVRLDLPGTATQSEKLSWEKELLGLYISEHPMNQFRAALERYIMPLNRIAGCSRDSNITVAGVVTSIKKIITRSNDSMLFVKIEDQASSVEALVFPSLLKVSADVWQDGKIILCQGKLSDKDSEIKLLANKAVLLQQDDIAATIKKFNDTAEVGGRNGRSWPSKKPSGTNVNAAAPQPQPAKDSSLKLIIGKSCDQAIMGSLLALLSSKPGSDKVFLKIFGPDGAPKIIESSLKVENTSELIQGIKQVCGEQVTVA
ncbi:DNA polymerase III subunit alpha [Candidatus Falkowbacteria bacterium]|nr:DNA polymerase III subunit alpha [Candidatus Falkowbacteria bacterium]